MIAFKKTRPIFSSNQNKARANRSLLELIFPQFASDTNLLQVSGLLDYLVSFVMDYSEKVRVTMKKNSLLMILNV